MVLAAAACCKARYVATVTAIMLAWSGPGHAQNEAPQALPDVPGTIKVKIAGAGVLLSGYVLRPPSATRDAPGVLVLHGSGGNAEDSVDAARSLAQRGYMALAITMRGYHGAEGEDDCGARQADDVVKALEWLGRQPGVDGSRLGMVGFGQGGQVALLAASRTRLPRAVVAYFPVTDVARLARTTPYKSVREYIEYVCQPHGLDKVSPIRQVQSIHAPVLLIHGSSDDRVPAAQSQAMRDALKAAGKAADLRIVANARHDFTQREFEQSWPSVVQFLANHQMLSLASRSSDQQRRVNLFAEHGWTSRLGARGIGVIRSLGQVQREKVVLTQNPHIRSRKDELREFFFDGLYVRALFPGRQKDAYLLQEVRVTKPRWKLRYGLNVGASRQSVLSALGPPDGERGEFVEYFHSLGIGTARIYFNSERISKVEWEFRAD